MGIEALLLGRLAGDGELGLLVISLGQCVDLRLIDDRAAVSGLEGLREVVVGGQQSSLGLVGQSGAAGDLVVDLRVVGADVLVQLGLVAADVLDGNDVEGTLTGEPDRDDLVLDGLREFSACLSSSTRRWPRSAEP